jgi:hypothetical protein
MSGGVKSLSGAALSYATSLRNEGGIKERFLAQMAYATVAVMSVEETIAAMSLTVLAELTFPKQIPVSRKWVESCDFARYWSVGYMFYNPFVRELPEDEVDARKYINIPPLTLPTI